MTVEMRQAFEVIGAEVQIDTGSDIFEIDVNLHGDWEVYQLTYPLGDAITAEALDVKPKKRHLGLDVSEWRLPVAGRYTWADWSKLRPRYGARFIRAVRFRLRVPEVITLCGYDRLPTTAVTFSRRNIFRRDRFTCQYCGAQPRSEELTLDHVVPRAQGGESRWDNCVLACLACNKRKADRTPQQAGMRLRKEPVQPTWRRCRRICGVPG